MDPKRRDAIRWFAEHAGYATPPGRMACARDLADAEQFAADAGWITTWSPDPFADRDDDATEHYVAALRDGNGRILATLGGIGDPDDEYRRVVAAELAAEAYGETPADEIRASVLRAAARDVLPDLERYAARSGPGPDRRLARLKVALAGYESDHDRFRRLDDEYGTSERSPLHHDRRCSCGERS